MHMCLSMANPSAKFSSRIIFSKSSQKCRIGQLIQNGHGILKLPQKTNRSFSLHSAAYYHHSAAPPSWLPHWHSKSSRQLFFHRPIGNNSMGYKLSQHYYSCVSSKYVYDRAQMNFNRHRNVFDMNSPNCKVMSYCNNSQSHHRLMSDSLPASCSDDNNTNHDQIRSVPMDIEELVQFLRDENASDICVIRVPPHLDYVDFFVVCSGFGGRHLRRMAGGLAAEMKSVRVGRNNRKIRVEGEDCEDWMCVDMGTTVVHFMMEEARSKYELEKLWALGPAYDDQYRSMEHILQNNP